MKEYKKTFQFGKVAAYSTKKANLVEIEATLKIIEDKDGEKIVFSASGNVWNAGHTDIIEGGQCIDDIWNNYQTQLEHQALYLRLLRLCRKWHLNDMHAGCIHQRDFENEPFIKHQGAYCKQCKYTYGTAWKYQEIDRRDLSEIAILLNYS